jgi:hypothetical protein
MPGTHRLTSHSPHLRVEHFLAYRKCVKADIYPPAVAARRAGTRPAVRRSPTCWRHMA